MQPAEKKCQPVSETRPAVRRDRVEVVLNLLGGEWKTESADQLSSVTTSDATNRDVREDGTTLRGAFFGRVVAPGDPERFFLRHRVEGGKVSLVSTVIASPSGRRCR
jgi:hypothetical protein